MLKKSRQAAKTSLRLLVLGFLIAGATAAWSLDQSSDEDKNKSVPLRADDRAQLAESATKAGNADPASQAKAIFGVIKGRILDYETQKPLVGVAVAVMGTDIKAQSDANGAYSIPEIAVGYYVLTFQLQGYYSDTRADVIVRPSRITFLNVTLVAARSIQEDVRVTADFFPTTPNKPVSQIKLNSEELRRDAGSAGDVSRALYNIPGVVKSDEEANDLIVRGGSPAENGFYLDNIFIPNINHFPQQGASGGNISMLNMDFIEDLHVYTGGFDASYGNRLSSIIDIGYREGNRERINSQLSLSMIGYGGQVEGPLPDRRGAWMFSVNRSFLDLISGFLGSSNPSDYYDLQGKVTYDLGRKDFLSVLAIAGKSWTNYDRGGREKFSTATAGFTWRHLWGSRGYSDTSVSYSYLDGTENRFWESTGQLHEFYDYRTGWITFRNVNHLQLSTFHQFTFGVEAQGENFRNRDDFDNAEKRLSGTSAAAFLTYEVHPFDNLSLSSGLRLDHTAFSQRFHLSPRLSFSWVLTKRLSVNGAFGMFYQQMPLFLLKQHPDNANLQEMRARHLVLGFKYLLFDDTQLTLEAYDKQYSDFPMAPQYQYYFVIDDVNGDNNRFWNFGRLVDEGKAYARGVEFTVQKKLAKSLYGLINLTYYRARYRDLMGTWRNRLFDNRFIVCLSGGYKPNKYWEFSGRWIWSGNKAFSPVNEEKARASGWAWVDYEDIMAGHLSDYQNLSLRIDRRFYFKKSNLVVFIGALNILDHKNELLRGWYAPYNEYFSEYMWGRIPYVGLEFEF